MATQTNCVCGSSVSRSKGKYYHWARGGKGSGRLHRTLRSTTQLCSSCFSDFIRSRPSHDAPDTEGTHRLCDFCNNEMELSVRALLFGPRITRWEGKVPRWRGNKKDVCEPCRNALHDYIEDKRSN